MYRQIPFCEHCDALGSRFGIGNQIRGGFLRPAVDSKCAKCAKRPPVTSSVSGQPRSSATDSIRSNRQRARRVDRNPLGRNPRGVLIRRLGDHQLRIEPKPAPALRRRLAAPLRGAPGRDRRRGASGPRAGHQGPDQDPHRGVSIRPLYPLRGMEAVTKIAQDTLESLESTHNDLTA